jgi:hypothetical protein
MLNNELAHYIPVRQALANAGIEDVFECDDGVVPACCSEGCEVEPDGVCEHGFPSVLIASGLI